MRDNIPDALIAAFERQYDTTWNDPQLRNERIAMRYGWAAAMEAKPCLHQIQEPAPITAMDALREAEAALEVAMARILKADPGHSICVTSEAKALVAVRAALAATPAEETLEHRAQKLNGLRTLVGATIGVPEAIETARSKFLAAYCRAPLADDLAYASLLIDAFQAAAPVVLPEPDGFLESHPFGSIYHRGKPSQIQMICGACPPMYEAGTVRALLATGGQAKADKEMQLAMQEASSLAQSIFKRHYSDDEHYASGSVVWGLCDSLRGVISQIDNMTSGLVRAPQAQAVERIAIDMKQTAELLDLFGGEATEFTVMQCNGHSGPGLYAYVTEYPEDGASFLGKTDSDATPTSQAQAGAREFPAMTPELASILGLMCFQCIPFAQALRTAGHQIKTRAEDEQAAVLHWMLGHWFRHGEEWRDHAQADMNRMKDAAIAAAKGDA